MPSALALVQRMLGLMSISGVGFEPSRLTFRNHMPSTPLTVVHCVASILLCESAWTIWVADGITLPVSPSPRLQVKVYWSPGWACSGAIQSHEEVQAALAESQVMRSGDVAEKLPGLGLLFVLRAVACHCT